MISEELKTHLESEGYVGVREIPRQGVCACFRFMFTVGLVVGIDSMGYKGRYCYPGPGAALTALITWDGKGDPPGEWIKYKGEGGERSREAK